MIKAKTYSIEALIQIRMQPTRRESKTRRNEKILVIRVHQV